MNQQPEAVENYIQQALTTERQEWNKLTRELCAQIDTLTDQLTTATRQKDDAIDTLSATLEARYNAESIYIETILDRNAEIEQLKARLELEQEAARLNRIERTRASNAQADRINEKIEVICKLENLLESERAYSDTVKKTLFAVIDQRDQISELLNAERIARQGLAQLLKANH